MHKSSGDGSGSRIQGFDSTATLEIFALVRSCIFGDTFALHAVRRYNGTWIGDWRHTNVGNHGGADLRRCRSPGQRAF